MSRFDGALTNYRVEDVLPAPSINDLLETTDGVYWVATNTVGVVRFDLLPAQLRNEFTKSQRCSPAVTASRSARSTTIPISSAARST